MDSPTLPKVLELVAELRILAAEFEEVVCGQHRRRAVGARIHPLAARFAADFDSSVNLLAGEWIVAGNQSGPR